MITLRVYLETLKKLPPNINKRREFRGKTIQQIITMNAGSPTIATYTIEKALTTIKTLFSWMVTEGLIDKNPSGILVAPKKEVRSDEERSVFNREDLQRLMDGLKVEAERGKLDGHPERYWLPLIGLFSGMRLGEIAQLHIDDVVQVKDDSSGNDIWCFKVQSSEEDGKSVKNTSSLRIIPVHKTLIDLGFIEYLKTIKEAGQPRLWMRLTLDSKGKWYKNFSNWFLKHSNIGEGFLRTYITTDPKKDFHSFRHAFANKLKQANIEEVKIAELVGHTNTSMTSGRYGKRYEIAMMKDTVDSLVYEGVDFGESQRG